MSKQFRFKDNRVEAIQIQAETPLEDMKGFPVYQDASGYWIFWFIHRSQTVAFLGDWIVRVGLDEPYYVLMSDGPFQRLFEAIDE